MNSKKLEKQRTCTMEIFLRSYVGIQDEIILERFSNLTHKQFKEVYEKLGAISLTRVPFELVTIEAIEMGDIIIVLDKDNNIAPYINPIKANFNVIMSEEKQKQIDRIYNAENHIQSFEDYIDSIDEIFLDKTISKSKIKRLSLKRHKKRKENKQ